MGPMWSRLDDTMAVSDVMHQGIIIHDIDIVISECPVYNTTMVDVLLNWNNRSIASQQASQINAPLCLGIS